VGYSISLPMLPTTETSTFKYTLSCWQADNDQI